MTAAAPGLAVRMTRVAWYRHRAAMAGIAGVFAVGAAVLLTEGLVMRSALGGQGLSRCPGTNFNGTICGNVPLWGDSQQHSTIVQLILDHGGLFDDWAPYADIQSLTYHFGFHAFAASIAWLTA